MDAETRPSSFAALLRRYRQSAGLTQEALAERARLSTRAVSDLERGLKRTPRRDTVALLADALGLTAAERAALEATISRALAPAPSSYVRDVPGAPSAAPAAPFVFLSFAQADRALVDSLVAYLHARGVTTWVDRLELTAGTLSWEQALRDAIRTARAVVLIASPNARTSRYVADELRIAEMYQRTVYPLWVQGEEWMECIPIGWGGVQHIDARGAAYEQGLRDLVEAARGALGQAEQPPVPVAVIIDQETPPRNPYKGLLAFTGKDASDFFGRERLVDGLLAAMRDGERRSSRFLAVVGPSGSGKSSVVLAGLLPRLRGGALPGSEEWIYLEPLAPGVHPLEALVIALGAALPGSSLTAIQEDLGHSSRGLHLLAGRLARDPRARVVLVVDQAEELFTLTGEEDERRQFIDLLVTAVGEPRGAVWVVLTLRADFYDGPMRYPALGALMESSAKSVLPMSLAELRAAIEQPAARTDARLRFEGDLVGDLLFEVRGQAGALPLLQFTLDQLFEHREGRCLTEAAYHALGGVHGALTLHAEATYTGLPTDEHRRLARALFLRLIDPGVTEQDTTRRRAALLEMELPDAAETAKLRAVADAFVEARLLVAGEHAGVTSIEVSHEALIREWGRLAAWLREARDDIRLQQALSADVAGWARRGQPVGRLYRGELLDEALRWAERNTPSAVEQLFLAEGEEERQRQISTAREQQARELALARAAADANRQSAVRLRYLVGVLILSLVVAAGLTVFAINRAASATANLRSAQAARAAALDQRGLAVAARTLALSRQLAAQAITHLEDKPDLALLLSVAANEVSGTAEAKDSLLRTLQYNPRLITLLRGHQGPVLSIAFSHDGGMLVSGGADSTIRRWNPASGRQIGPPLTGHTAAVTSVALSPSGRRSIGFLYDGRLLASASDDGTIRLWDPAKPRPGGQALPDDQPASVTNLAFSPTAPLLAYGGNDATIRLWNAATGQPFGQPLTDHSSYVTSVAFSPDGRLLAAGADDGSIRLWDVARGRQFGARLTGHTGRVTCLDFSPDGALLASGSADKTIRVWPLTGSPRHVRRLTGHLDRVTSVAFSPDGRTLASGSADDTARVWDLTSSEPTGQALPGRTGSVNSVAFSPNGALLAAGEADGTIWLWSMRRDASLGLTLAGHTDVVNSVAFSTNGATLVSGSGDTTVRLWDVARLRATGAPFRGHTDTVSAVAFSPRGDLVASGGADKAVWLWDVRDGHAVGKLLGSKGRVSGLAFSRDGRLLAAGSLDGTIRLWDVQRRQLSGQPLVSNDDQSVNAVALSPDGRWLASGEQNGTIWLWDVARRRQVDLPFAGHTGDVNSVAFSPDSRELVSGGADRTVRLWSMATGQQIAPPLLGHTDSVTGVAFSSDGARLASSSLDGTIRLWDAASGQSLGQPLTGHTGGVNGLAFSTNGRLLASAGADSTIRLWDVSVAVWEARACREANRDLTALEWARYLGEEVRHAVCPRS